MHVEVARLQDIVEPLLDAGMNVVVDHFGRPDPDIGVRDVGFRRLLELADTQRVWVKISAAYRNRRQLRPDDHDAHEAFHFLKAAFGVHRLMWGSDWPHTQFEADEDFTHALELLRAPLPVEEERRVVLADTPARLTGSTLRDSHGALQRQHWLNGLPSRAAAIRSQCGHEHTFDSSAWITDNSQIRKMEGWSQSW
ncbi:putative TIM-barrel fold metal-dependent hydrolase [Paraburkholderia atlantica]|uniref:Putative TIM-barrel fold metal-dependent hydrolase n=1 Tax=Paraburkholderia atlantica TaxID=2654982 RepID=A0A7W8Q0V1_PARAM|nr:amidohydrolase family protein [Paraburkholderia atlantica]MBB5421594.1 putative TIM-barrel fold metal-dependent hydrolase [Paraburkholderia atlantica]MBB5429486.1 putative TIM-barrel fold metal-dependent hydrolase [Paraburkholderia atlantica]